MRAGSFGLALSLLVGFLLAAVPSEAADLQSFLDSAVFLRDERGEVGTGFLVGHLTGDGEPRIFLVTNRHALPEEGADRRIWLRVRTSRDGQEGLEEIALTLTDGRGKYLPSVLSHSDPGVDVAAMHISLEVEHFGILTKWLEDRELVSAVDLESAAMVGDEVWVIGYPGANFDGRSAAPLVLGGVLATEPAEGFAFNDFLKGRDGLANEIDGFLVHSAIVPGSSGSMVISRPGVGESPRLLGIVSRSLDWVGVENGPRQGLGLGIAFSAATIREVLATFDEAHWVAGGSRP